MILPTPTLSRRRLLAAVPATALLAACGGGGLEGESFKADAASAKVIDHGAWNSLLGEYVSEGPDGVNLVAYDRLKAEAADKLAAYLAAMQAVTIEGFGPDEQFAYWVNLYNAATVAVIIANLPLKSIRDIGVLGAGPWRDKAVTVAGRDLTLDNIEHDILRATWKDVRIHYAVNCASYGCPNLAREAYTGARLEPMLEAAARAYVNHPRGFGGEPGRVVASSIYDWYGGDWGSVAAVLDHARKYAEGPSARLLEGAESIAAYDYDWSLNAA
ncbi:DUF547 domain-containing protein [Erythrobacter donghaensis]|jgi:hypothetical protein|nr:DUF547 domain-containing protein [Erythrobacter donghaensis]